MAGLRSGALSNPCQCSFRSDAMHTRCGSRRRKGPQSIGFRPQVIPLEARLPLGDALLGSLLASSWLGAKLASIREVETPEAPIRENLLEVHRQPESWVSVWAVGFGDAPPARNSGLALAPSSTPPMASGVEGQVDFGTTAATAMLRWPFDLLERPAPAGAPGVMSGPEATSAPALSAGFGQTASSAARLAQSVSGGMGSVRSGLELLHLPRWKRL
jgi:hypothetical protein